MAAFSFADIQLTSETDTHPEEPLPEPEAPEELPLVYEVTLEELMAMAE